METLQKTLSLIEKFYPDTKFYILQIDGVILKITKDISVGELKEQYDQRTALLLEGEHRALKEYYRKEGLLECWRVLRKKRKTRLSFPQPRWFSGFFIYTPFSVRIHKWI